MTDDAMLTELPEVLLVGPELPSGGGKAFAWKAALQIVGPSALSSDTSLVNSTLGMRVLLQAPAKDRGPDVGKIEGILKWKVDLRLRTPHLLSAVAFPKTSKATLLIEGAGVEGSYPLYPHSVQENQGSS